MANYNSLKATIDAQIKANGVQAITGPILNAVLTAMINTIGNGYTLQGSVAQTTDNPGAPDNPVAYLAAGPGTYTNFGGTVIPNDGHAYLLTWDTSWHAVQLPLPTFDLANGKQDALTFDDAPTPGSDNPVKSNGIAEALDDKQDKDTGDTAGHVAVMDGDGNSVDGGAALADLATKEDVEAVEQEVAQIAGEAGLAEAVIDTDGAGTEQEFTFRKSGGDGGAYYRKIKGKTLAWNQLVRNGNFSDTSYWETVGYGTISVANNIGTFTVTDNGAACRIEQEGIGTIAGHKYLLLATLNPSVATSCFVHNGTDQITATTALSANTDNKIAVIVSINNTGDKLRFYVNTASQLSIGSTVKFSKIELIDLTLMFGAGNEPSTVAEFEALYPDAYYPHNPGTLISNDAEAVETTGVNQWDEEWELGTIDSNGVFVDSYSAIRAKNYYPVQGGKTYRVTGGNTVIYCYDANKTFIPYTGQTGSAAWMGGIDVNNTTFVLPSGTSYIRFCISEAYGTTYKNDICINLSNPAINGQYFPYWKRTLQLGLTTKEDTDGNVPFADGMKGAGTASDWADKVGGEKRVKRVKLSSLSWDYIPTYDFFNCIVSDYGSAEDGAYICGQYSTGGARNTVNMGDAPTGIYNWGTEIKIKDTRFSNVQDFLSAMGDVEIDYKLATPVPFTWKEPLNLGVKVDENGTERAVAPEGATAPSAPFVADTTYTMSIARMVAKLQSI